MQARQKSHFIVCSRVNATNCKIQITLRTILFQVGALSDVELKNYDTIFLNCQWAADRHTCCALVAPHP